MTLSNKKPELMIPETLFKFCSVNENTFSNLLNNTAWFSPPSLFNDPFDCQIEYIPKEDNISIEELKVIATENNIEFTDSFNADVFLAGKNFFKKSLENFWDEISVLSLTDNITNTTMWSHYAESHKGICIEYKTDTFIHSDMMMLDKVEYEDNIVSKLKFSDLYMWILKNIDIKEIDAYGDLFENIYANTLTQDDIALIEKTKIHEIDFKEILRNFFYIKSGDWRYESEWRAIRDKSGLFGMEHDSIVSITFGYKTPSYFKTAIMKIFKSAKVVFFEMQRNGNVLIRNKYIP